METIKQEIIKALDSATAEQLRILYLFAAHLIKA